MNEATHSAKAPILIVGGGIGGCAAAIMLSKVGYTVSLLEQADELSEIGAGIQLGPNAFRMFDALGITAEIEKSVVYPEHLVMMDGLTGDQVTSMKMGQAFIDRFGKPYGVIYRADLHRALVDACENNDNVTIHTGCKVAEYDDTGNSVKVTTEDNRTFEGAALIGCDGLWSRIRSRLLNDGPPRVAGHIAYRAVLPIEEVPEHLYRNDMVLWAGPRNHLVHYPLRKGALYNLVAVFHSDRYVEGWDAKADPEELHARFAQNCEPVKELLSKIETWRMWVLCDREPVKTWSKGRVTLLGDAAHPMLQYMAQGAAMAMEDAVCLAGELRNTQSFEQAFARYQDKRYLRTGRVQLTARLYGEAYHAAGVTRELRNNMLESRTDHQGYDSLAWLYDPSNSPAF
ncbi:MAG: salicylate hydroxylase [Alcaligenaceae bacterium]|nr:salicylate hydroxylase [Alcaligenaceae bacterium]